MQTSEVDTYDEPCSTVCGPVDFGGRYARKRAGTDTQTHRLTHESPREVENSKSSDSDNFFSLFLCILGAELTRIIEIAANGALPAHRMTMGC